MLNDRDLERLFGLPHSTARDWKNRKEDNWRYKLIHFLKEQDKEAIKAFLYELENNAEKGEERE